MFPRPAFRLPIWVAFGAAALAYVVRSASRGFDFRPELPSDVFVLVLLLVVVSAVAWVRADDTRRDSEEKGSDATRRGPDA